MLKSGSMENMMVAQLVNEFSAIYGKLKTFPSSLDLTSGPSVEPHKTCTELHILFIKSFSFYSVTINYQ
jgi:hypothetical protein